MLNSDKLPKIQHVKYLIIKYLQVVVQTMEDGRLLGVVEQVAQQQISILMPQVHCLMLREQ